jgi:hypothetical protein
MDLDEKFDLDKHERWTRELQEQELQDAPRDVFDHAVAGGGGGMGGGGGGGRRFGGRGLRAQAAESFDFMSPAAACRQ